jgi:protein-disulfide isomerase
MKSSWIIGGIVSALVIVTSVAIWAAVQPSATLKNRIVSLHPDYEAQLTDGVFTGDWKKGTSGASVQVIEYADYECPACASIAPVLHQAMSQAEGVEFIYRNFPLPQHAKARTAARAAEAAGRQGKFWEMNQIIFSQQTSWAVTTMSQFRSSLKSYAESLGLNTVQFEADMSDSSIDTKIQRDQRLGNEANVSATPTVFVNGTKLSPMPTTVEGFLQVFEAAKTQ